MSDGKPSHADWNETGLDSVRKTHPPPPQHTERPDPAALQRPPVAAPELQPTAALL